MEPYNIMAGFEPLKILQHEPETYRVWATEQRIEPRVQLEYNNPVISECDYDFSNQGLEQGPAADHAHNGGSECDKV